MYANDTALYCNIENRDDCEAKTPLMMDYQTYING